LGHFGDTRARLIRALEDRETERMFAAARPRHDILAPYSTLLAALDDVLGLDGAYGRRRDIATTDALLRALLGEQRDHPHRVWTTALTAAFFPAITNLRRRVVSSEHDDDDRRDLVLEAWLEAIARVARVSDRDRLAMRLVQEMERHAFRVVRVACRQRKLVRSLGAVARDTHAIEPFAHGRAEAVPHAGDLLVEIREVTARAHDGDDRELARKLDAAAPLTERMRLLYPDLAAEDREQMYQRVKRRGTRAMARAKSATRCAELGVPQPNPRRPAIRRRRKRGVR
jgi:hypothetical protein